MAKVEGWDIENKSSFDMAVDFFVHSARPAGATAAYYLAIEIFT